MKKMTTTKTKIKENPRYILSLYSTISLSWQFFHIFLQMKGLRSGHFKYFPKIIREKGLRTFTMLSLASSSAPPSTSPRRDHNALPYLYICLDNSHWSFRTQFVIVVVQSLSWVQLLSTPWTASHQASLSFTVSWSLLKLIALVMPFYRPIICCPLLLLPSIFPSIRVFSNESVCIRWPKYWSFSISPSNEFSGLISFEIGWFDLLAVKRTLKSLLQHNLKASLLRD